MEIPIIFENDDVVVIDKPSGVMVHPDGRTADETIADWHADRVPTAREVGEPMVLNDGTTLLRSGIVHRLDTETSGVLILAKHDAAFLHLKHEFHERMVEKEYRAFVYGEMKMSEGEINRPIGRSTQDFRLRSAQRGARGTLREAVTSWRRIVARAGYSYVSFFPKTGRTHQIRVHAKAINHPIVHDTLYAPHRVKQEPSALGFSRLALHAYMLSLTLPSGELQTFTAPLPEDFIRAETHLRNETV